MSQDYYELFENLSYDQLLQRKKALTTLCEEVSNENEMYASYLKHQAQRGEKVDETFVDNKKDKRGKFQEVPTILTTEQKHDIAISELSANKEEVEAEIKKGSSTIETLEALLKQAEVCFNEVKKDAYEFKRDIALGAVNPLTGRIYAERVVRYYENYLRRIADKIEKTRLRNQTLKTQQAKLSESLKSKEEAGDILHYIDFHQLRIENSQYIAKIEERNNELLRLKLTSGNTVATLNQLKSRLSVVTKELQKLKHDIRLRGTSLGKLHVENAELQRTIADLEKQYQEAVQFAHSSEDMPETMDYIELTRTKASLEKEIHSWKRKLEIALLEHKRLSARASMGSTSSTKNTSGLRNGVMKKSNSSFSNNSGFSGSKDFPKRPTNSTASVISSISRDGEMSVDLESVVRLNTPGISSGVSVGFGSPASLFSPPSKSVALGPSRTPAVSNIRR